ncbi:MAG: nucleotide sugar dehydrogenase [Nibricoccus sp.]
MNISIFGLGYVGCVATGCLAQNGHRVTGVDPQQTKVDFINAGQSTIIEEGIAEIIAAQRKAGRISATRSVAEAVLSTEFSFICVGTPPTPQGHLDLSAIVKVAGEIGAALKEKTTRHVVAVRSTVLPGTREMVEGEIEKASGRKAGQDFAVVSNPEFLREGTSVKDFFKPPYTLLGSNCEWATEMARELYKGIDAPFITTEPRVAELMKYVCNSFHALKIVFANEVGNICKTLDIDSHQLMEVFCKDTKLNISPAYLKPGFAYGGSCLPKDLKALRTIAHDNYLQTPVLEAIERSNEFQKELTLKKIMDAGVQNVGFLGLAFKAGTDDLRESPIIDVIERLLGKGYSLKIYDPHVHVSQLTGANRDYILKRIPFISRFLTDNLQETIDSAELLVVVNKAEGVEAAMKALPAGKTVYDIAGLRPSALGSGVKYSGISW